MKKLLAMLLVLMLALPCAALAEPSTAYTIALMNPVVSYMGQSIDMTGLDLELSAIVSDVGQFAATALVNVGQNFEHNALSAQAQLDSNGLTFTADGMSDVYSLDLKQFTNGFDVTTFLPMIPAYSMLKQPVQMQSAGVDMSLSARYAAVSELLSPYANNGSISIDRTQGELLINQLLTMVETASSSVNVDGVAELRAQRPAFDLNGALTVSGDPAANNGSYALVGTGNLYVGNPAESLPFDITLTDSASASNAIVNIHEPGGTEVVSIALDSVSTPDSDGRTAVQTDVAMTLTDSADPSVFEELMSLTYSATPKAGSRQMDYVVSLNVPEEETSASLLVSTGTNGDDIGFAIDMFYDDGSSAGSVFMYYTGAKAADALGTAISGQLSIGGDMDGMNLRLDTGLLLRDTATDTAEWAYDSSAAIPVESMDQMQSSAAMMGLMGIAGTAMTLINENVPGLAPFLSSMMAGMM